MTARFEPGRGFPLGFADLRKSQLPGIGGPGHQEVDDLHVVVEPEAEARVMLLVEGLEQPGDLGLGERIDVDRDFELVILA